MTLMIEETVLLKIGKGDEGFTLPLELVTSTQAILARKRSGKSYTASVEAEELLEAGQQVVVIDPTSAWHGLRSSADGEGPGYPVVVFGGDHADAPLDYLAGKAMAAAVVEHGFSCIFDVGTLPTEEQLRFVMDFAGELLRINRRAMHVYLDEADTYAPQKPLGLLQNKCLGAVSRMVKQGGIRGIGFTMITQRPASMNKDVLSQVDILTVLRMSHPLDVKAATDWIKTEVGVEFAKEVESALPSLPVGTAFFCSAPLHVGERVEVRARRTFNSGATPKPGERRAEPKVLASVDIARLGQEIAASVERVKAESPEHLKRRVAELEAQLKDAETRTGAVDMGFIEEAQAAQAELERLRAEMDEVRGQQRTLRAHTRETVMRVQEALESLYRLCADNEADEQNEPVPAIDVQNRPAVPQTKPIASVDAALSLTSKEGSTLSGPAQRILAALAQFRGIGVDAPSKMLVCLFSGYSNMTSKGFANAISALRTAGMVDYPGDGTVTLTQEGIRQAPAVTRAAGNEELHARIFKVLSGPEERILRPLLQRYPRPITKDALMATAGYTNATSKGFANSLSRLRTMGLIDYPSRGEVVATAQCFVAKI